MDEKEKSKFLVVDDDQSLRELMQIILETAGIASIAASSAEKALQIAEERLGGLAGVILDLNLEHAQGERLIDDLQAIAPDLAVFVVSGCLEQEIRERIGERAVDGVIAKPFRSADFIATIKAGIGAAENSAVSSERA